MPTAPLPPTDIPPTAPKPLRAATRTAFFLLVCSLLFSSFHWNIFHIEQTQREGNIFVVDCYVVPAMEFYTTQSATQRAFGVIQLADTQGGFYPYLMQTGLQRIAYSALSPNTVAGVDRTVPSLRILIELLLALTFTAFLSVAAAEFGLLPAAVAAVLLALSNWLIVFAPDLFWICTLFFLPFVLGWLLGDPARSSAQRRTLAVLFTLACFLKCLCGFDYTTNIFAAIAVPFLYFGLRRAQPWKTIALRILRYGMLSVAAFASAIVLQVIQFFSTLQSPSQSIAGFLKEIHRRTLSNGEGINKGYDRAALFVLHKLHLSPANDARIAPLLVLLRPFLRYLRYLSMGACTLPLPGHPVKLPIGLFVLGFLLFVWRWSKRSGGLRTPATGRNSALLLSTLAALVVSHLWIVAANGHMTHTFFNAIVFYIPFLPMAYLAVGVGVSHLTQRLLRKPETVA